MLEKPHFGWSRWELPNFHDRISYVDDFPFMVLEVLIDYFESGESRDLTFEAEGWQYTFTFGENVKVGERVICESTIKFAQEFIDEIEDDLDMWAHFARRDDSARDELVKLINELKGHLPKRENPLIKYIGKKFEEIQNPDIDDDIRNRYFRQFEELNTTTSSIYDLGDLEVLIILKDGTNLTSWRDVLDKNDVIYVSEDVSGRSYLSNKYSDMGSLKSIIIKGMTDRVSSLNFMFDGCFSLEYVFGVDTWDTSNLENMRGMFYDCSSLRDISFLESLDVSNVKGFEALFQACISLEDISPLGSWDVANVENMHAAFCICQNLESLKGLESWDVGNVEKMESMFHGCSSLTDISQLAGWKPERIENLFEMFRECGSLENTDALNGWEISDDVTTESMFRYCNKAQMPQWYVNSTQEIEDYVKGIDDEEELIDIAYNHPNYITRKFAIENIADEGVLRDLIQNKGDPGVFEAAIKNENLKDYEFLMQRLEHANSEEGIQIIARIDDEHYLEKIAKGSFSVKYRLMAINKITDRTVLADIGENEENTTIRNFALNRLNVL